MTVGSRQFPSVELASKLTPSDAMDSSPPTHTNGLVLIFFRLLFTSSASLQTLQMGPGILVQPAPIDAHLRRAWMPYFRRDWHLHQHFWTLSWITSPRLPSETFPSSRERSYTKQPLLRKPSAGGLDRWAWMEIKTLSTCSSSSAD